MGHSELLIPYFGEWKTAALADRAGHDAGDVAGQGLPLAPHGSGHAGHAPSEGDAAALTAGLGRGSDVGGVDGSEWRESGVRAVAGLEPGAPG